MKRICLLLILLNLLSRSGYSQITNPALKLTGNMESDLKILTPNGEQNADIMDGIWQTPRQDTLTRRFQEGIKKNAAWFLEFMKTVPQGKPMPYHSNMGLTKEEYTELLGYFNNIELISSGRQNININRKDDIIRFKSQGKLKVFDSLTIDLKNNIVRFGQYKLIFSDSLNIRSEQNGLKSKWKGYSWKFEDPDNLSIDDLKDLSNLKLKQYKFTIGRLEKNGKTFMSLKGAEIDNGLKTVNFELPVIF